MRHFKSTYVLHITPLLLDKTAYEFSPVMAKTLFTHGF